MPKNMVSRIEDLWRELKLQVCMAAYVGENYERQEDRILVIGESMYLPESVMGNLEPKAFYDGVTQLSLEQQNWLNYRAVIAGRYGVGLKNIEKSLDKVGISVNDIAMFNFFQRPMLKLSGEDRWSKEDIEIGEKTCHQAIELLSPTKVIIASYGVAQLIERHHSKFYPEEEFWNFADKLNFKYICVHHPSSPYWSKSKQDFEKFVDVHGQERFRQLSDQFEYAIYERNMDELIHLARTFQVEVSFMDEKRKGKCGVVKTQEDADKNILNCKKARVAKKAKKICGVITECFQKYLLDMNNIVNTDSIWGPYSREALGVRRDIACKDAHAEIDKFKKEFANDEVLKDQLEKGVAYISSVRDTLLNEIDVYFSHPYMLPFVGDDYDSPKHKKLLLVGESHYMPEGSTVHHDVNAWYNGNPVLTEEEQDWCNTRGTREWKSGRFGKEIDRCLNLVLSTGENGWQQVASYNYFLRPADNRQSIEDLWKSYGGKDIDREYAIKNFIRVLEILKPDLIVFLSSKVCACAEGEDFPKYFGGNLWDWTKSHGIEDYIYTMHPSSPHWNKPMPAKYGKADGLTSCEFFCKWLKENWV